MESKISRTTLLCNILIISTFSMIQASTNTPKNLTGEPQKKGFWEKLISSDDQPSEQTPPKPSLSPVSANAKDYPVIHETLTVPLERTKQLPRGKKSKQLEDAVLLSKTDNPNVVTERVVEVPPADSTPKATVSINLPIRTDELGATYPMPTLPEQTATAYAWGDVHILRSDIDYVLGLIANGTFNLAYTEGLSCDSKLPGRNSNGLLALLTTLSTNQQEQGKILTDLLRQQRKQTIEDTNKALLLLKAINAHKHPKKIDLARLESEFDRIKRERAILHARMRLMLEEAHAQDTHFKELQEALNKAHLTGDKSLPLSPRKNVEDFTKRLLQLKK